MCQTIELPDVSVLNMTKYMLDIDSCKGIINDNRNAKKVKQPYAPL
jgi:hypothetical protein